MSEVSCNCCAMYWLWEQDKVHLQRSQRWVCPCGALQPGQLIQEDMKSEMGRFIASAWFDGKRFGSVVFTVLLMFSVSACSSVGAKLPWNQEPTVNLDLIAANLVNTASQLPHLSPTTSPLQIRKDDSDFSRAIRRALEQGGFNLENISRDQGMNQVASEVKRIRTETREKESYVLRIGRVSIERAYSVINGHTVPVSEQNIRGVDDVSIALNDDIFVAPSSAFSSVAFKPYEGPRIDDVLAAPVIEKRLIPVRRQQERNVVKQNIYETMSSNYKDVFAGFEDIDQSVLIFPNDSLRLGEANKRIIEEYVEKMDPETDVLSVIGCSHGNTKIDNGNSLLAIGRANRVKEAFLFSGLQHDQILDEGCWAPQTFDEVMPSRGVVLTLKRQRDS